jgi:hypothetical protein
MMHDDERPDAFPGLAAGPDHASVCHPVPY